MASVVWLLSYIQRKHTAAPDTDAPSHWSLKPLCATSLLGLHFPAYPSSSQIPKHLWLSGLVTAHFYWVLSMCQVLSGVWNSNHSWKMIEATAGVNLIVKRKSIDVKKTQCSQEALVNWIKCKACTWCLNFLVATFKNETSFNDFKHRFNLSNVSF